MVTLKDIAVRAGVSLSAVSIALNHKKGISEATREKILGIAHELNYETTKKKAGGRGTLRFLKIARHERTINRDHHLFIAGYIDGMAAEAMHFGYALEVVTHSRETMLEIVDQHAPDESVQGLIILGTELATEDLNILKKIRKPLVVIDSIHDQLPFDFVDMNNRGALYQVLRCFRKEGFSRVGMIASYSQTPNFMLREEAFRDLLPEFGWQDSEQHILYVDSTFDGAYKDMLELLEKKVQLAECYFCVNDIVAYGCIKAFKEHGIQIPRDISLAGFDDLPMSSVMEPSLSTIRVANQQMGELAVYALHKRIVEPKRQANVEILVDGTFVRRDSIIKKKKIP